MTAFRFIARLDIKGDKLIKSIQLEGVQVIGDPRDYAQQYYHAGADEIILMDAVASLYGRNQLHDIIKTISENIFIPITVGGGIRHLADVDQALKAGADKIAINTAAINQPNLITEIAQEFGSQCCVLQIDAKQIADGWEAYTDGGRERSHRDAVEWAHIGTDLGAGEILLTSIDKEGTGLGFDLALIQAVAPNIPIPVIACGGMKTASHLVAAAQQGQADAVASAHALHIERCAIDNLKSALARSGIEVRQQHDGGTH